MIEVVAVGAVILSLVAIGLLAWRAAAGPARGIHLAVRFAALGLVITPAVVYATNKLSRALTFQFFGELIPRVETSEKVVALTLDDGPTPAFADTVLAMLRDGGARATFFLNGEAIDRDPSVTRRIIAEGHQVGNHSYTHPHFIAKSLAFTASEIERTDEAIRRAGYQGEIVFRVPYGKRLLVLPYYLSKTGRKTISWTLEPDSYPSVFDRSEHIVDYVVRHVRPGSIILLHVMFPSRATSLHAVPGIISELHKRGYRFVTVSELLQSRQ